jgi:hypothetical protein
MTANKNLILTIHPHEPPHRAARLHLPGCKFVERAERLVGAHKAEVIPSPSKGKLAELIQAGMKPKRCTACLDQGPGAYIPDSKRHTERITLRMRPEDMATLKSLAIEWDCTFAEVVVKLLKGKRKIR